MVAAARHPPASKARRDARDQEAVLARTGADADGAQGIDGCLDAIGLLGSELLGAGQAALAARACRGEREERELVDGERHLLRTDGRADECRGVNLEVSSGLTPISRRL